MSDKIMDKIMKQEPDFIPKKDRFNLTFDHDVGEHLKAYSKQKGHPSISYTNNKIVKEFFENL